MAYATQADMIARFGEPELIQLTDRQGLGVIDATVLDQALFDADVQIDAHLAGRYSLPLDPVPAVLVPFACDLARLALYTDAAPETVQKRADKATRFLELVAKGTIQLGLVPPPPDAGAVQFTPGDKVFGRSESY